jgi:hypothetical protein
MKIILDKEREWKLNTRAILEYSRLGFGSIKDITDQSTTILAELAVKLGDDGFAKYFGIVDKFESAKTPQLKAKYAEELGRFVTINKIRKDEMRIKMSEEQAIALLRIGLNTTLPEEEQLTDVDICGLIDEADKNDKSPFTPRNFHDEVYKLIMQTNYALLDKDLKVAVPLD